MPQPNPDPPPPDWDLTSGSPTEFNDAQSAADNYGYDSTNWSFKDSTGTPMYLYVGKSATSGHVAWFLRTVANSGDCPKGKINQDTFNVVWKGTLNTQTGVISYDSHTYLLDLRTDANGVQIAYAKQLT